MDSFDITRFGNTAGRLVSFSVRNRRVSFSCYIAFIVLAASSRFLCQWNYLLIIFH
ncbi:hypothetical protein GYMLUDRAFT_892292 [Collybiopsis luxurians FD-317 M1]|uniref:Uncharacterized protein n=1 Tax=Collybiopsis luxurians FD-317 M1 TaxID=944289 RepID=A0A0D0AWB0_9AGAR|nr:hypothetical protein GYMLUDRAFT_892292 [Collybiopsis luxurians FD-317 M1]